MINYSKKSGQIGILNHGDGYYTVILDGYSGTLEFENDVLRCKLIVRRDCSINSDLVIYDKTSKLDKILIEGQGNLKVGKISSTSIDINCNITTNLVVGNAVRIQNCKYKSVVNSKSTAFSISGHISIVDSTLDIPISNIGIDSPYVIIDNSNSNIHGNLYGIFCNHEISVENATITSKDLKTFVTSSKYTENGYPKEFLRRIKYSYYPARLASNYDKFKDSSGYTNVNLHRRIDQNSGIKLYISEDQFYDGFFIDNNSQLDDEDLYEPYDDSFSYSDGYMDVPNPNYVFDEVASRKYEVGIYDLESYRTTEISYHDENSLEQELP